MGNDISEKAIGLKGDTEMNLFRETSYFDDPISKGVGLNGDLKETTLGPILKALKFKDISSSFNPNEAPVTDVEKKSQNNGTVKLFGW